MIWQLIWIFRIDALLTTSLEARMLCAHAGAAASWTQLFPECIGADIYEVWLIFFQHRHYMLVWKDTGQNANITQVSGGVPLEQCLRGCANYKGPRAPCLFVTFGRLRCIYKNGKTSIHSCDGCNDQGVCIQRQVPCNPSQEYCSASRMATSFDSRSGGSDSGSVSGGIFGAFEIHVYEWLCIWS